MANRILQSLRSIRMTSAITLYAIFYGTPFGDKILLDHIVVTNGADFFCFFKRLPGNVVNKKNQIRLPKDFFDR